MTPSQQLCLMGLSLWFGSFLITLWLTARLGPSWVGVAIFAAWAMAIMGGVAWGAYFQRKGRDEKTE